MVTTSSKFIPIVADEQKFYAPIFPSHSSSMNVSLSIQAQTEYVGNISINIVYWDGNEKIIIKDYLAGQDPTSFDFTINNPTSVPPFIVYIDSDNPTAVDIGIDYDLPLTIGPLTVYDTNILSMENLANPALTLKEYFTGFSPLESTLPSNKIKPLFETASSTPSPLVVDLDGDGVETVGTQSGTHFDHDGNGFAESTGWAGRDDGILIRDLNNNGQIDSAYNLVRI